MNLLYNKYFRLVILIGMTGWFACASRAATLADFGYQNIKIEGETNLGGRPLLVILVNYDGRPAFYTNSAYYQNLVFNAGTNSLYGFFRENSKNRFYWSMAAAAPVGPLNLPWRWCYHGVSNNLVTNGYTWNSNTSSLADTLVISNVLFTVMSNGFDFRPFDKNGDGIVRRNELSVIIISNENEDLGASRSSSLVTPPNTNTNARIDMYRVAHVNHRTDFVSMAHELGHVLGAVDLYDSSPSCDCKGLDASTMSCTLQYNNLLAFTSIHLDPWHKMQFGWIEPRIYSMNDGGIARLFAPQVAGGEAPVLLYDPARDTDEFFMLEYRTRTVAGNQSVFDVTCDDVPGMAIWYIKQKANHMPFEISQNNRVLWNLRPPDLACPYAFRAFWAGDSTTPQLPWMDGTLANVRLGVRPFHEGDASIVVEWMVNREQWVDFLYTGTEEGTFIRPWNTVAEGVGAVPHGGIVQVKTGRTPEGITINKRVSIFANGGPVTVGER